MDLVEHDDLSSNNQDQVVELKIPRPFWLKALIVLGIVFAVAAVGLGGWWAVVNLFNGQPEEEFKQVAQPAGELTDELREQLGLYDATTSQRMLLDKYFNKINEVKGFYYEEKIITQDIEEKDGLEQIKETTEEMKQAWVNYPDEVYLRAGYFTELIYRHNKIFIKDDPDLSNFVFGDRLNEYSVERINAVNLILNERLALQLLNNKFNWLNPDLIVEVESNQAEFENERAFHVLKVRYDVDKLKMLWADQMNTQITEPYLEGFELDQSGVQIEYHGEIWLDQKSLLPQRIIISRQFKEQADADGLTRLQKVTSQISYEQFGQHFEMPSLANSRARENVYDSGIFEDQYNYDLYKFSPPLSFPIHTGVITNFGDKIGVDIFLYNPFDFSVEITLSQDLPEGVAALNATYEWSYEEQKVQWQKQTIEPKEIGHLRLNISVDGQEVVLPATELTMRANELEAPYVFLSPERPFINFEL